MLTLTGFADEISTDLATQLDVLESLQIGYLELRGVWGKGVMELTDDDVTRTKSEMERRGVKVSAIGSPIGKISIDDPFEPHLADFRRAVDLAETFGCQYIRMFSFYVPEGTADAHRAQVMDRLGALLQAASGRDVVLLHENERSIYGDIPRRCKDIMDTLDSPQMRATFDPGNFVHCDARPFDDAYGLLEEHIEYLHVKDARASDRTHVPAGQGDGQFRQVLSALQSRGFHGFASLEPHLKSGGQFRGFSGPEMFETAAAALRGLMAELGIEETS